MTHSNQLGGVSSSSAGSTHAVFGRPDSEMPPPKASSTLKSTGGGSHLPPSNVVPLSIQTFFWTRTSTFLKREWYKKRDYESACVLFEKVVVLNEMHGQSDAFCVAVKQLGSRWKLVCIALPHLIHCCSIALHCRDRLRGCGSTTRLPPAIDKLFASLHWCLVDAPRTQLASASTSNNNSQSQQTTSNSVSSNDVISSSAPNEIYPVDIVQLFVSCFCPVIDRLRQVDLLNLAPGVDLWGKLSDCEQPGIDCFAGFVKLPFASQQFAQTQKAKQLQFRNIGVGAASLEPVSISITTQDESSESSNMSEDVSLNRTSSLEKLTISFFDKDQAQRTFSDGFSKAEKRKHLSHPTFFDIAVIRCLFNPNWAEKGVKWALKYLQKRFVEIRDLELSGTNRKATRSHSTPVPIIKVSIEHDDDFREKLCDIPEIVTEADESVDGNENTDKLSVDTGSDLAKLKNDDSSESDGSSSNKGKPLERQESFDCELDIVGTNHRRLNRTTFVDDYSKTASSIQSNRLKMDNTVEVLTLDPASCGPKLTSRDRGEPASKSDLVFASSMPGTTCVSDPGEELNGSLRSLEGLSGMYSSGRMASKHASKNGSSAGYLEPTGTIFYIQEDGTFNYEIILRALYVLTNRGVSQAVIELILPLVETLMSMTPVGLILSRREKRGKKNVNKKASEENLLNLNASHGTPTSNASGASAVKDKSSEKDLTIVGAMICMLTRLIREVGCFRSTIACELRRASFSMTARGQALTCLSKLHSHNDKQFRRSLSHLAANHELFEVIDFLHALLGSCQSANYPLPEPWKKFHGDDPSGGYSSRFRRVHAEEEGLEADIESAIVVSVFKTVLTRIVNTPQKAFDTNSKTYIRLLMQYIRENHGDIFRLVAFSGMLDSVYDSYGSPEVMRTCFISVRQTPQVDHLTSTFGHLGAHQGIRGDRRGTLFGSTVQGSPDVSGSVCSDNPENDTPKSSKKLKKGSTSGVGTANVSQDTCDGDSMDSNSALAPMAPTARHLARRKVIFHKASDAALSLSLVVVPPEGLSGSKEKSSLFKKFKNKLKRDAFSNNDSEKEDSRDMDDFDANSCDNLGGSSFFGKSQLGTDSYGHPVSGRERQVVPVMKAVDWVAIHAGMKRLSFLMDCCHPGNIPDAAFVASALHLKSPVVARAALFAECSNFVHRCSKGEWPEWLRPGNSGGLPLRRGFSGRRNNEASSSSNTSQGRVFDYYLNATKLFFLWGEALAHKLNELITAEAAAVKSNPLYNQFIPDEATRLDLRREDDNENFLQDLLLNPTGERCPYALKMMACLLLTEITIFMREVYPNLPKGRARAGTRGGSSNQQRRDTDSDVTLTTGDQLRRGSSKDDSSMTTLDSGALGERKISFAVEDEDSNSLSSHSIISGSESRAGGAMSQSGSANERSAAPSGMNSVLRSRKISAATRKTPTVTDGTRLLRRHTGAQGSFRHGRRRSGSIYQNNLISQQTGGSSPVGNVHRGSRSSGGGEEDGDSTSQISSEETKDAELDYDFSKTVPWVGVIVKLVNGCNFECNHQAFCHLHCYQRRSRSCQRLVDALRRVYGEPTSVNLETLFSRMMSLASSTAAPSDRTAKESYSSSTMPFRRHPSSASASASFGAGTFVGGAFKTSLGSTHHERHSSGQGDNVVVTVNDLGTHNVVMNSLGNEESDKVKNAENLVEENTLMTGFLKKQAHSLMHLPFVVMCKTAAFLPRQIYFQIIPASWQLLMDSNLQLASSAAALFLISGVKSHDAVFDLLKSQLGSEDASIRIQTLLRFGVLWRYRYQVWPQLEDAAVHTIKVPPPSIDFTQPSPQFGTPPTSIPVVDPPWMPHLRDKTEEAISEDKTRQRSFAALGGATTRSHQREEHNKKIRLAEEEKTREGREKFRLTQVAVTNDASFEMSIQQQNSEQDNPEQAENEQAAANPDNASNNAQNMNLVAGGASVAMTTTAANNAGGGGGGGTSNAVHHGVTATMSSSSNSGVGGGGPLIHSVPLFPSAVCAAVPDIIALTDDKEVSSVDGISVREVALGLIKTCLIEDTSLFLRYFLERLTVVDKHASLLAQIRKLTLALPEISPQAAHSLFNYLTGLIMYFIRNPSPYSQQATATTLSVLWMIVRSVRGLTFKDLKQTLKKEQCDPALLVTAIIPVAKKLIVTGGDSTDMPIPFNVTDDLSFVTILNDSLTSFRLDLSQPNRQPLLVDKTGWIMGSNMLVRDFYSNRRGGLAELQLDVMQRETRHRRLVSQVIASKMAEIGRILISRNLLRFTQESQLEAQVNFVHTELTRLPSFPRKCLEFDLPILKGHVLSSHLLGIDAVHKQMWVWLLSTLFERMPCDFAWASGDLVKFMTVYNGAIVTHADESSVLRFTLAAYLTAAIRFNQTMLLKGYQHIMPVLFTMYRECKQDSIVCKSIEFVVKQFYVIHRKPFVLQFLGSVAHLVHVDNPLSHTYVTQEKVPSKLLYDLLICLDEDVSDPLDILDLVNYPKPLKNLDFCYREEIPTISILDIIQLCVLTIGYAPESVRGKQMLKVLEALTPHYITATKNTTRLMKNTGGAAKAELICIQQLSSCVKGLAAVCESFAKNAFNGTSSKMELVSSSNIRRNSSILISSHQGKSAGQGGGKVLGGGGLPRSFTQPKGSFIYTGGKPVSGTWEPHRVNLRIMSMTEVKERKYRMSLGEDESVYREFREPRCSLLHFATICHTMCHTRATELRRLLLEESSKNSSSPCTNFEIIDAKTHSRLMEVALALLKVAPHDPLTMGCYGLQRYITELVPNTDWSSEANRNVLNSLLKRLEKVFLKITKKHAIRRQVDWDFVSNMVKGVYLTLLKQPYVAHSAAMKAFLSVSLNLVLDDGSSPGGSEGMAILQLGTPLLGRINLTPPPAFISAVIRLTALQMHLLKDSRRGTTVNRIPMADNGVSLLFYSGARILVSRTIGSAKYEAHPHSHLRFRSIQLSRRPQLTAIQLGNAAIFNQQPRASRANSAGNFFQALTFHKSADYPLDQILNTNCRIICGQEKAENIFINLLIPLFTHMGSNRQDCPRMRTDDVSFICHTIFNTMLPSSSLHHGRATSQNSSSSSSNSNGTNSAVVVNSTVGSTSNPAAPGLNIENVTHVPKAVNNSPNPPHNPSSADSAGAMFDSFFESGFLALKFLVACFPDGLKRDWVWMAGCVKEMGSTLHCGIAFWDFLLFIIEQDAFLFTLLKPFLQFKMCRVMCATEPEMAFQFYIQHKIFSPVKERPCKGTTLEQLGSEFRTLKARNAQTLLKERLRMVQDFYDNNYRQHSVPTISVQSSLRDHPDGHLSASKHTLDSSSSHANALQHDYSDTPGQMNWNRRLKRVKKQLANNVGDDELLSSGSGGTIAASHLTNFSSLRNARKKSQDISAGMTLTPNSAGPNEIESGGPDASAVPNNNSASFKKKVDQEIGFLKSTIKAARGQRRSQYKNKNKTDHGGASTDDDLDADPDQNHRKSVVENCHGEVNAKPLKSILRDSTCKSSEDEGGSDLVPSGSVSNKPPVVSASGSGKLTLAMRRLSEQLSPNYSLSSSRLGAGIYTKIPTTEAVEDQMEEQKSLLHEHQVIKHTPSVPLPTPTNVSRSSSLKGILSSTKSPLTPTKNRQSSGHTPKSLSFKRSFKGAKVKNKTDKLAKNPSPKKIPKMPGGKCSLPPNMVPVEQDDSSYSERRPPPLPRFVLNPSRLIDNVVDPAAKVHLIVSRGVTCVEMGGAGGGRKASIAESVCTIEDVENYSELPLTGGALPPRPIMRLLQAKKSGITGNFGSRRSSQESGMQGGLKLAPLQHMESLEEWSSGESMAMFNNFGADSVSNLANVAGKRKWSAGSFVAPGSQSGGRISLSSKLNRSNPDPNNLMTRTKLSKDTSVPNFATAMLEENLNNGEEGARGNSRPVSVVIEMESLMNKDSNSTKV
ncbi:protein unc-80-like isoform X4 [Symsagittifera roscoffensis]|uniref:protein unc-80-like isoform X4 n=1 Tax=Symsagittifera roscoffensis TaxID=84072 RepID=UPI00307C969D